MPAKGFYGEHFDDVCPKATRSMWRGQQLAGPWRGAFAGTLMDSKARAECHKFSRKYNSMYICDNCYAVQLSKNAPKELNFKTFTPASLWMLTMVSHAVYKTTEPNLSPWADIPGWHFRTCWRDLLHVLYLGWAKDLIPAVLASLWDAGCLNDHADLDAALRATWMSFMSWCRQHKISAPSGPIFSKRLLGLDNRGSAFPELSSKYKGATTKLLIHWIADYVRPRATTTHLQLIATCCWCLTRCLILFEKSGIIMSEEHAAEARRRGRLCLVAYQKLAVTAESNKQLLWRIRPKTHYFYHILEDVAETRFNPLVLDTFKDESFLGYIKRLVVKSHASVARERFMMKYITYLAWRWQQRVKGRHVVPT